MAINLDPSAFIIQIELDGNPIEVDLTDPTFEPQVCAAASRFYSLRRKRKAGPKGKPIRCICGDITRTTRSFLKHIKECPDILAGIDTIA